LEFGLANLTKEKSTELNSASAGAPFSFLIPLGETFGLAKRQIEWLQANHSESVRIAEQAYRTFGPTTVERLVLKTKAGKFVVFESPEFQHLKLARVQRKLATRAKKKSGPVKN
jgi:hypothetical protein